MIDSPSRAEGLFVLFGEFVGAIALLVLLYFVVVSLGPLFF